METEEASGRARPRPTEKRQAIVRAAREVFGRVGYLGASIDMIAAEAAVSTRTIYNHFENKEQLFAVVLTDSTEQVAAEHEAIIRRHLRRVTDVRASLIACATEWAMPRPEFDNHFAIVRRIVAEGDNFPRELYDTWQEAGPRHVQRVLAEHLALLGEQGLLEVPNAEFAAQHFVALVTSTAPHGVTMPAGCSGLTEDQAYEIATVAVQAFLYGYLPRD
jgi:AcrR family transcriptional regulator